MSGLKGTMRYNCLHTIHKHEAEVTDLSIHPLGEWETQRSGFKNL